MAKLECPECGLLWDDDPEINDASHCDCGYPIDSMFLQASTKEARREP